MGVLATETLCGAAAALALSALLGGCATRADRWRALSAEGPLVGWAACMEKDGYRAFNDAGAAAMMAREDGATPISNTEIFLIALKACESSAAGTRAAELAPQRPNRLYRDTERRLQRKLANDTFGH